MAPGPAAFTVPCHAPANERPTVRGIGDGDAELDPPHAIVPIVATRTRSVTPGVCGEAICVRRRTPYVGCYTSKTQIAINFTFGPTVSVFVTRRLSWPNLSRASQRTQRSITPRSNASTKSDSLRTAIPPVGSEIARKLSSIAARAASSRPGRADTPGRPSASMANT